MKKIKYSIVILAAAAAIAPACVNLDTVMPSQLGSAQMWTNPENTKAGVDAILNPFRPSGMGLGSTEGMEYPNLRMIARHRIENFGFCTGGVYGEYYCWAAQNAGHVTFRYEWKYVYEGIHIANDAIVHIPGVPGLSDDEKSVYLAEAKILRAMYYHRLNMLFRGVPIYLEPVLNTDCTKPRNTMSEVWNQCLSDLNDAINTPKLPDNTLTSPYGRPSKGAAWALKGEVYMWLAWLAQEEGDAEAEKNAYNEAILCFDKVEECGYGLWHGDYMAPFTEAGEKCSEMILPLQFSRDVGYGDWTHQWYATRSSSNSTSRLQARAMFVDSFHNADGTPFDFAQYIPEWNDPVFLEDSTKREVFFCRDSMNFKADVQNLTEWNVAKSGVIGRVSKEVWDTYYLDNGNEERLRSCFANRDPRLRKLVIMPYEPFYTCSNTGSKSTLKTHRWPFIIAGNGDTEGDLWPEDRTRFRYEYNKFVIHNDPTFFRWEAGTDFPLLRFTDIYLQKAEALNAVDRFDEAIAIVNEILVRAGMPTLNDGQPQNAVAGKEELLERIQHESRIELCCESVNYFHELRWRTYKKTLFNNQDKWGEMGAWGQKMSHTFYWEDHVWYWPIPAAECQKNPNLERTPGWIY
ncbi:MAG: RagB/SusD family nutrient uptake outer membrane protein [Bacteroidales bacterium]|nr:RagB/SusD family nutrient uptake outer membrane protein [Candidatus Cryptobacteroides aphodequi]